MKEVRQDLKKKVQTLEGPKEYVFCALARKDAAMVFHNTLAAVVSAVAGISTSSDEAKADAVFKAVNTLDFETLWGLAEVLLRFAVLDGEAIDDLNESDYFNERPEELYLAVFHAVLLNWPNVFLKVKEALSGSGLLDQFKTVLNRGGLETV